MVVLFLSAAYLAINFKPSQQAKRGQLLKIKIISLQSKCLSVYLYLELYHGFNNLTQIIS